MNQKLIVSFDLENTLIDSWNSNTPLVSKIQSIKYTLDEFLCNNEPKYQMRDVQFSVFSFAIDHPHEIEIGLKKAFDAIQYNMNPTFCPCWQDLEKLIEIRQGFLQKYEVVNLYGKAGMFNIWTRQFPDFDFLLFDDAIPDEFSSTLRINKTNQRITMIRV